MADYDEIIQVDAWSLDETYDGVFPKGAREKNVYFSPETPTPSFLRPNHRYLFKKSSHRYPWQFWMEIMAYRIGQIMGVSVPPAYAAISEKEGGAGGPVFGALIEWFYEKNDLYVDGGRLMSALIPNYDTHKGTQHNLETVLKATRSAKYWARVLTFDTIIGNVDRHQDNWGMIFVKSGKPKIMIQMSPAFDNGTALNYEIIEDNFCKFEDESYANRYLTKSKRARHHMRWNLEESGDVTFYEFMGRFLKKFPEERESVAMALNFGRRSVEDRLSGLTHIAVPEDFRLTPQRLTFTIDLLMRRKELLEKAIEVH